MQKQAGQQQRARRDEQLCQDVAQHFPALERSPES